MKNLKRQAVCILAMLTLIFTLVSCGVPGVGGISGSGDKAKFLGTWKATVDVSEAVNADFKEGLAGVDEELADYFQVSRFELTLVFTFNKDDTYSIRVDEDALKATVEDMKDEIKDGALAYLEHMIEQAELDMTVDELLETSELDLDELADSALDYEKIGKSFTDELECEGKWKARSGELYLSESVNEEVGDKGELYEITSDGIRLTDPDGSADDEMGLFAYAAPPMHLDRGPWCTLTGQMVHGDRGRGARTQSPLGHSVRTPLRLRMVSPLIRIT